MPAAEVEALEETSDGSGSLVAEPVDWNVGKNRSHLERITPDWLVFVTWQVTLSSYLGEWRAQAFRDQRRYGRDEDLRIVCFCS